MEGEREEERRVRGGKGAGRQGGEGFAGPMSNCILRACS